jgi:hypothetical protein
MIGIVSGHRWQVKHRRFSGSVFSGARILVKLFKRGSGGVGLQNQVRIEKRAALDTPTAGELWAEYVASNLQLFKK